VKLLTGIGLLLAAYCFSLVTVPQGNAHTIILGLVAIFSAFGVALTLTAEFFWLIGLATGVGFVILPMLLWFLVEELGKGFGPYAGLYYAVIVLVVLGVISVQVELKKRRRQRGDSDCACDED
jgi:hypothetical protein